MKPNPTPKLKLVPTEPVKKTIDEQTIDEIIGRSAEPVTKRVIFDFEKDKIDFTNPKLLAEALEKLNKGK